MIPAQQSNMSLLVLPCLVRLLQDPDPIIQQDVPLAIGKRCRIALTILLNFASTTPHNPRRYAAGSCKPRSNK